MPNLAFWSGFSYTGNDGGTLENGSLDVPSFVVPTSGLRYATQVSLAQNGIATLYDATVNLSDFVFCCIESDTGDPTNGYVMLELVTDNAGVVKQTPYTVPLVANMPLYLFGSQSYANYTVDFGGGTLKKINFLRAKNLNSVTATVSIWMLL